MRDGQTKGQTTGGRSFEERVLAALADLQTRFTGFENRLAALEAKQYDTKPIWERALAEILEVKDEMRRGFRVLNADLFNIRTEQ